MRCPSCNKFVSNDADDDPEIDVDIDDEGSISGTCRITIKCAECGEELKEATFDIEIDVSSNKECERHIGKDSDKHTLSVDVGSSGRTDRSVGAKPNTPARYRKQYYGAEATFEITCSCGKLEATEQWSEDIQSSAMDELT